MDNGHGMLVSGINHVAILTADTSRLCAFYTEMFGAVVDGAVQPEEGLRLTFLRVGPTSEFNVFEVEGNTEADRQTPMFGRGRIDHLALNAGSLKAFDTIRNRLIKAMSLSTMSPTHP